MKCANCDAEIKDGSIYCPVCGKEAQMVNGYTSLEDDFLHSLLREGIEPQNKKKKRMLSPEEQLQARKRRRKMTVILMSLVVALVITTVVVLKLFVDYKRDNSYEYQMKMAQNEMVDHNYESAMEHLARALSIVPDDVESRLEMAKLCLLRDEQDTAVVLLTEVIRLDKNKKEAYEQLIEIYAQKEQYRQIQEMAEYVETDEIKVLFKDYLVDCPTMYPGGDTFYNELKITLYSYEDCAIYYTTDGSDPIENGKRYIEGAGISLNESGLYKICAVCKNRNDIYSEVISENYQIILAPPIETEVVTEEETEVTE